MTKITWLASYPKSGNTRLRLLLEAYQTGKVDLRRIAMRLDDQGAYLWQRVSHKPLHELGIEDAPYLRTAALLHLIETSAPPRLVKTHSVNGLANDVRLIPPGLTRAAVYVVRDPRDIVASWVSHFGGEADEVIERFGSNTVLHKNAGLFHILGSWPEHVRSWWRASFPVHVERYEDFDAEPEAALRRVLEFLGWPVDAERVRSAVEAASFDAMRRQEEERGFREAPLNGNRFFRKGTPGAWRDELTETQARRVEAICGEVMEEWGYPIDDAARQAAG